MTWIKITMSNIQNSSGEEKFKSNMYCAYLFTVRCSVSNGTDRQAGTKWLNFSSCFETRSEIMIPKPHQHEAHFIQ